MIPRPATIRWHMLLTALVVCALALRALIPAGYMPGVTADGQTTIVICTAKGPKTIALDTAQIPTAPAQEQHSADNHSDCAFAPVLAQDIPLPA